MKLRLYISVLFLFCIISAFSQTEIKKDTWQKATKDVNYTENFKEFEKKNKNLDKTKERKSVSPALLLIPLVAIAIFIIVLIVMFIVNAPRVTVSRKIIKSNHIETEDNPDEYTNDDLASLLNRALEDKDYRLAIRIQFLMLIKLLQDDDRIIWKKEKTNFDYYFEIKENNIKEIFRSIVLTFERIWYANYKASNKTFQQISTQYSKINTLINE